MSIIVVDVETTGLDPARCGLIEIGYAVCSEVESRWEIATHGGIVCMPRLGALLEVGAAKVNGFNEREPVARSEKQAVFEFAQVLDGAKSAGVKPVIAAWRIAFDLPFIEAAARAAGLLRTLDDARQSTTLDIPSLVYARSGELPHLGDACRALGLGPEPRPHVGVEGARRAGLVMCGALNETLVLACRALLQPE